MCVAEEKSVSVYQPLFLQIKLPYSIVKGEQTEVQATLFNYGTRTINANVYMYGQEGVCSESLPGDKGPVHNLVVAANDAQSTSFNFIPLNVGTYDIQIKAFTDAGNDAVKKTIRVVAEGVQRYHSKTIVIDPAGARESAVEPGEEEEPDQPLMNEFPFAQDSFSDHEARRQTDTIDIRVTDKFAIPNTAQCYITFFGDIMTPTVSTVIEGFNPGDLLGKPQGCGEQTMMYMSANVYTMFYLLNTNQITAATEETGFENVKLSYEQMINFQLGNGAFAAFQNRPASTWLTAYTTKVFYNVLEMGKFVDKGLLCKAYRFFKLRFKVIENTEPPQGLFYEGNVVIHKDMVGGISGDVLMTAFVVITLTEYNPLDLDVPTDCQVDYSDELAMAIKYLEANVATLDTVYHLSVVTYALTVANSNVKDEAWAQLKLAASYDSIKSLRHWPMNSPALITEATSYALLTSVYRNEIVYANGMVNWLLEHRSFTRGFSTTSDTAIALEALSIYASENNVAAVDIRCKVTSTYSKAYEEIIEIDETTSVLSQRKECPVGGLLLIVCEGPGLAQAEVEVVYNSPGTDAEECAFYVDTTMIEVALEEGKIREKDLYTVEITVNYQYVLNGRTDMVIVEVGLFSGFLAVQSTLDMLVASDATPIERYEIADRKIIFYLEFLVAGDFKYIRFHVEQWFNVANVQSARVAVYDYYNPTKHCTAFYNPHDDQPELRQVCNADSKVCECAAGACPPCLLPINELPTEDELYFDLACGIDAGYDYVFEVYAQSVEILNGFITLLATVSTQMKEGRDTFEDWETDVGANRLFIIKSSCVDCQEWVQGHKYLIMGKDGLQYKDGNIEKLKYLLDNTSYTEKWPKKSDDKARAKSFNRFKSKLVSEGCAA